MTSVQILFVLVCLNVVLCRDFYMGIFRKKDLLVAQDTLYKERVPFRSQYAKYGRRFKCPITYLRVVDRLGMAKGPRVEIMRGGLLKKFIVLRLTSLYNSPVSVNIYIGCENKMPPTTKKTTTVATTAAVDETTVGNDTDANETTVAGDDKPDSPADGTTVAGDGEATTAAEGAEGAEEAATEAAAAEEATEAPAE